MNQPPLFNAQFLAADGTLLSGGLLYTYVSGTTTNQTTYSNQSGGATNANPIVLDASGRCDLWLDPLLEYTLVLKTSAGVAVRTWDDVQGSAAASGAVTSVNTATGAVVLTADDIGFTTSTSTTWFVGTDVTTAIDALITRSDSGITAASVPIVDAGGLITATNVESALAELAGKTLPTQSGNSGKYLTTDGTAASWAALSSTALGAKSIGATGYQTLPSGLIMQWGTVSVTGGSTATFTFPLAFPNACFAPQVTLINAGGYSSPLETYPAVESYTTASCVVSNKYIGDTTGSQVTIPAAVFVLGN
jgi:hypothetical protein